MSDLEVVMPGVQSGLHLHECPKHGSCYEDDKTGADAGATPDEYFAETLALMKQLNESAVQALFADHLGEVLSRAQIEAAFDQAFGAGPGSASSSDAAGEVEVRSSPSCGSA
jgi:ribonuclease T2